MLVTELILLVSAWLYPPGRLFCVLAALVLAVPPCVRAWRRGIRWPAILMLGILLASGGLARHAASELVAYRDARRAEPPRVDGTYEGSAEGLRGPMRVSVRVARARIADVRVLSWCDSPSIAGEAVEATRERILAQNTPRVPRAPGAPESTVALCRSVEESLWSAGGPKLDPVARAVLLVEANVPRTTTFTTLVVLVLALASLGGLMPRAKA